MKSVFKKHFGIFLLFFVILNSILMLASNTAVYSGCGTGYYCYGTVRVDYYAGCASTRPCTQLEGSVYSCDQACKYDFYDEKCKSETDCSIKYGTHHQGGCCIIDPNPPTPPPSTCTPVPCKGCVPGCPSGQSTTNTGAKCKENKTSCTGDNGCGTSCTVPGTADCYLPETNSKPSKPTSISLKTGGETKTLSTSSSTPTIVRIACDNDSTMYVPSISPSGAREIGYKYTGTGIDYEGTIREQKFADPSSLKTEDAEGEIKGSYYTLNKCNDNKQYSDVLTGYYKVHTNTAPEKPSKVTIIVDGERFDLEKTESNKPTRIKHPSAINPKVETEIPKKDPIEGLQHTVGSVFEANNKGVSNEWQSFGCTRPEDYCSESASNNQEFKPHGMSAYDVLKEGAEGEIKGSYYATNLCNENPRYSDKTSGYYKVNNLPKPDKDIGLSFSDEPYVSETNCTALPRHTGEEVNRVVDVKFKVSDEDGVDDIRGFVLYFNRDNTSPEENPRIVTSFENNKGKQSTTDFSSLGLMIIVDSLQNPEWNQVKLYGTNSNKDWEQSATLKPGKTIPNNAPVSIRNEVQSAGSSGMIDLISFDEPITNIDEKTIEFNFKLKFNKPEEGGGYLAGNYEVRAMAFDALMMMESNTKIDQSHLTVSEPFFDWTFDLDKPELDEEVTPIIKDSRVLELRLGPNGLVDPNDGFAKSSGIRGLVLDAYRGLSAGATNDRLTLIHPSGYDDIHGYTEQATVGRIGGEQVEPGQEPSSWSYGWHFKQSSWPSLVEVDIHENELGDIPMYITAYDNACNKSDNSTVIAIDLKPWIATKGGVLYSQGGFGPKAKNLSALAQQEATYNQLIQIPLKRYTQGEIATRMTTGTAHLSSASDSIIEILYASAGIDGPDRIHAVRSKKVINEIGRHSEGWFYNLKERLDKQILLGILKEFNHQADHSSPDCNLEGQEEACFVYTPDDIEIKSGYICNKKTLFMTEGNIIINPNVSRLGNPADSSEVDSGCIFVAKGDIKITGGEYLSRNTSITQYDFVQGYMIADGHIEIALADTGPDIVTRDGLEIEGGLIAFGQGSGGEDSAILLRRNLRLLTLVNPVLVVTWDVRYPKISELFFGKEAFLYKQEVGFKVF